MTENGKQSWTEKLAIYLLIGATAGAGGGMMFGRPDPFTGTDAKDMEQRLQDRLSSIDVRVIEIEKTDRSILEQLARLPPAGLLERVTVLEQKVKPDD